MRTTIHTVLAVVPALLLFPATLQAGSPERAKGADRLFSLAGQAGLPRYLKGNKDALADLEGIRGGEVRTTDTDYINKDFVFDVVFQFKEDEKSIALIGIGENGRDGGWIVNSVLSRIHGPGYGGYATITYSRTFEEGRVGEFKTAGPHLFRLEKKGAALTMAICANYKGGEVKPDFSKTIPDLKRVAPYLNRLNSTLFFGGDATFKAVRLEVNGKPVDPGSPANQGFKDISGPEHLVRLAGGKRWPGYLKPVGGLTIDKDGLNLSGTSVRTRAANFLDKNFTFDVVYHFQSDQDHSIMLVGIGENGRDGGWLVNTVCARVHGPGHGGPVTIAYDHNPYDSAVGKLGQDHPGPNLFRLQRCGDTLMVAVCADYKGRFEPDIVRIIPDLRHVAPYLTAKNSSLFLADGGVIEQVRLVVEGEDVESYDVALDVPAQVVEGQAVRRKILNDPGARRFSVESAPPGLTLTPAGELAWTPTPEQVGHHQFKVRMTEKGETTAQVVEVDVLAAPGAKAANSAQLPMDGAKHKIVPGLGGTSLLLLEGDRLRRLDADGLTVRQAMKLPGTYEWIGERKDYFVALSDERKSLDLIDKQTLQVRRGIPMDYPRRFDLALHPLKAISYVTVEKATKEGPRTFILVADESSGDVHEHGIPAAREGPP